MASMGHPRRGNRQGELIRLPCLLLLPLIAGSGCNRSHSVEVVATVNGHAILHAEMEKAYKDQLGEAQQQPSQEQADSLRLSALAR